MLIGISRLTAASALLALSLASTGAQATSSFTLFESGQVRPLSLSPSGKLLFAANTPDNRIEVYRVKHGTLSHRLSIPVGLEPVAVAARSDSEVWVVNHLSDSVSVVHIDNLNNTGYVVHTLLVGDEPRDIVFGGPLMSRAFITTAHRGQNIPFDPQLTTPSVGRADVWIFDADNLGASLGGDPLTILTLFSDTPRALAVSPDGTRVYAAAFHSGNQTTSIHEQLVPDGGELLGGVPEPRTNHEGNPQPEVGLIVKWNGQHWVDELNRSWDDKVKLSLPDKDVFVIDATANPPAQLPGSAGFFTSVGTILFNMTVNPVNGKIYVSNTEAFNEVRFEGPGTYAGSSTRGHLHESRITVLSGAGVAPRHLNKHIDYSTCCAPIPNPENAKSLAFPQSMAVSSDGSKLYVAALGSSKVGIFNTSELETDTFVPSAASHIVVTGGGPTGLALHEGEQRLYVLTRFDNSISVINTATKEEVAHLAMHNPEPASVVQGRRFLYDAAHSSSHGDSACGSCHVFGDFDSLAWDLGNPDGTTTNNPGPFTSDFTPPNPDFAPMKGPMTTQSLRGLANHGPMHWRGDRTGGNDEPSVQPDSGAFSEVKAFMAFNPAFEGLIGRSAQLTQAEMQAFTDFVLQITYPPNPIRNLDDSLTPEQQAGKDFFFGEISDVFEPCNGCHVIDRNAGFFGSSGLGSFEPQLQTFKVPHLRNQYQMVGMFGKAFEPTHLPVDNEHKGDQVRGFGFLHDGSLDTIFRFNTNVTFAAIPIVNPGGFGIGPAGDVQRRDVEAYLLASDTNLFPIVGQQITLTSANAPVTGARIDLLKARANQGECDLVAKSKSASAETGFLYIGNDQFSQSRISLATVTDAALRQSAVMTGAHVTYTCVPPGSGWRIGIDRDGDGVRDGDEHDAGTNPADPMSHP